MLKTSSLPSGSSQEVVTGGFPAGVMLVLIPKIRTGIFLEGKGRRAIPQSRLHEQSHGKVNGVGW